MTPAVRARCSKRTSIAANASPNCFNAAVGFAGRYPRIERMMRNTRSPDRRRPQRRASLFHFHLFPRGVFDELRRRPGGVPGRQIRSVIVGPAAIAVRSLFLLPAVDVPKRISASLVTQPPNSTSSMAVRIVGVSVAHDRLYWAVTRQSGSVPMCGELHPARAVLTENL